MSIVHDDLGPSLALIYETTSIQNLLRDGLQSLESLRFVDTGVDAVFTLLSIGVEKLMKVTLGLVSLRDTATWSTVEEMRRHGHNLEGTDTTVRTMLRANTVRATYPAYVAGLLDQVETDQYWPRLLRALHQYGKSGRFHYLDLLANGHPGEWESPVTYLKSLEGTILDDNPRILVGLASANWPQSRRELNAIIAKSVYQWWGMIYAFWIQGAIGPRARQLASAIKPPAARKITA